MSAPRKIITTFVHPPIPIRTMDWQAHFDGDEETGPFGEGATEYEAVKDLIENYDDAHLSVEFREVPEGDGFLYATDKAVS